MTACPTGAIRTLKPVPLVRSALDDFPMLIDETLPGVYYLGYHHQETYAASSYLVVRPGGNILIDLPRFNGRLANAIERLGGVEYLIVTSKSLEAGHLEWKARFPNMARIMHACDETVESFKAFEQSVEGLGPWELEAADGGASDVRIVHTPGRTAGSMCVWVRPHGSPANVLFSGGLLTFDVEQNELDGLAQFNAIEVGLRRQAGSMRKLCDSEATPDWQWLLPSFGARRYFPDVGAMRKEISEYSVKFETAPQRLV